jgi:hypothetical protein
MILTYSLLAAVAFLHTLGTSNAFVFQIPTAHRLIPIPSAQSSTKLFTDTINSNNHKQEGDLKIDELVDEAVYSATVVATPRSGASDGDLDNSATELLIDDEDEPDEQTLMDRTHMDLAIQTARAKSVLQSHLMSFLSARSHVTPRSPV